MELEDGFSVDKLFNRGYSYTYNDFIFLPHYIDFPTDAVSLSTRLSLNIPLSTPCVSSPMDTVSDSHMAAAMASLGAMAIVHYNLPSADQASFIKSAKSRRVPILSNPVFASPDSRILNEFEGDDAPPFVLVTAGCGNSKLLSYAAKSDWLELPDKDAKLADYMRVIDPNQCVLWNYDLEQVNASFKGESNF